MDEKNILQVGVLFLNSEKEMWLIICNQPHLVWWSFEYKRRVEQIGRIYPFPISQLFSESVRPGKLFRDGKLLEEFK